MKRISISVLMFLFFSTATSFSKTWIVDQNGLGDYTSISQAINIAKPGDIVKVYPGIYNEKVVINKDILVEGSGAENTMISNQNNDNAVVISIGTIKWFTITSQSWGINASGGIVTNCIVKNCPNTGICACPGSKIINCISLYNKWGIAFIEDNTSIVVNCMSLWNTEYGFTAFDKNGNYSYVAHDVKYCISFGNKNNYDINYSKAIKSTGSLETDPKFNPNSYQISEGSPCKDAGNSAYQDPDGTRSDMGYYGGPDAPTFPVISNSIIKLNEDGTIQLNAVGISPY